MKSETTTIETLNPAKGASALLAPPTPADSNPSPFPDPTEVFFSPAKPEQFQLPQLLTEEQPYNQSFAEADRRFRGWLSDGLFTKEIGSWLSNEIHTVEKRFEKLNEAERELNRRSEAIKLETVLGENWQNRTALAAQFVQELNQKNPGVLEFLENTGAADDAGIIVQLTLHAEHLARKKGILP